MSEFHTPSSCAGVGGSGLECPGRVRKGER